MFRQLTSDPDGSELPTVSALLENAHVSRSAFYSHFRFTDEVAVASLQDVLDELSQIDVSNRFLGVVGATAMRRGLGRLLTHIGANRSLYSTVLFDPGAFRARGILREAMARETAQSMRASGGAPGGLDVETAAAWVAGGVVEVLRIWLTDGQEIKIEEKTSSPGPDAR